MTGPQGMGPLMSGGLEAAPPIIVPYGPMAEIVAFSPFIYHPLDVLDTVGYNKYLDYGTADEPTKPWSEASETAATLTHTEQLPFQSAARLVDTDKNCFTTDGVSYNGVSSTTTYSVFVKFADPFPLSSIMALFANGSNPVTFTARESWIVIGTGGDINLYVFNGGTQYQFGSGPGVIPDDGEWHMISIVFVPSTSVRFYVDAMLVATITTGLATGKNDPGFMKAWGGLSTSSFSAEMGGPAFPLNGWLSHVFVVNGALTEAELKGIYNVAFNSPDLTPTSSFVGVSDIVWALHPSTMNVPVVGAAEAGDSLFMHVTARHNDTVFSGLAGWTLLKRTSYVVSVMELWVRPMSAGLTVVPITPDVGNFFGAYTFAVSGVDAISSVQETTANPNLSTQSAPIFAAPAGSRVISLIGWRFGRTPDNTSFNSAAVSPPWTMALNSIYPGPNAQAMGLAWAIGRGGVPVSPGAMWTYGDVIEERPTTFHQFYLT